MPRRITRHLTYNAAIKRWVKRIDGKIRYFGESGCTKANAMAILNAYIDERIADSIENASNAISIGQLAIAYELDCEARVASGKLQLDTLKEYRRCIQLFLDEIGSGTIVGSLRPAQFRTVRLRWDGLSPPTRNRYITGVRTMFMWGVANGVIVSLPMYGREFDPPDKSEHRAAREIREREHGERKFRDDELRRILLHPLCDGWMRACVMLGLNAGMYGKDCSDLLWKDVCTIDGVVCIDRRRAKTGVRQTAPLWPETITLLETMRRPGIDRVFRTPDGNPLINRDTRNDYLGEKFMVLRGEAGIERVGIGFGSLRHTHVSAIGDCGDDNAARRVRGHEIAGVVGHYDKIPIRRLKAVTDLARDRLLVPTLESRSLRQSRRGR